MAIKSPVVNKSLTPKGVLNKVTKPNLKNVGRSIKPTTRSIPFK